MCHVYVDFVLCGVVQAPRVLLCIMKCSLYTTLFRFPQLTSCYGENDRYYTQEDAREVVQYAKSRGIRVIPEVDIP